ncbi:LA_2168 family protein [Leptospira licerasiae]|uniref:LA_2168 family protein n=1 Tax=Leptospira licerasiae TaxID=447106 RepID=UPI003015936A
MKRIFLLFVFLHSHIISADNVHDPSLEIYFQWILFRTQGRISEEKEHSKISALTSPAVFGFKFEKSTEKIRADIEWNLVTTSNSGTFFLPGKNSYIGILYKGFLWGAGRRSDPEEFPAWSSWKDGVEGLFAETELDRIRIRFDFLDLYRGFPLSENQWLKLQGREFFLPKQARDELISEKDAAYSSQSRYRAGISLTGNKEDRFIYKFRVRYLSLGDWGRFGSDTKESRSETTEGDKDYLVEWKIGLGFLWKFFFVSGDFFLSRGIDKTGYHPARLDRSIPISGEAFRFDLGFYNTFGKISFFGFLPDRERRSSQGEILEMGFVGMGSSPVSNPILQQVWGFYPSARITDRGLEREDTDFPGKRPANLFGWKAEGKFFGVSPGVHFTYIGFLKEENSSSGLWTISFKNMHNKFLREAGVSIVWSALEDESARIELDIGGFESDETTGLKQWYMLFRIGGVWK